MKPSLSLDAPKLVWRLDLQTTSNSTWGLADGGPVPSMNRLVVQAGDYIYFVNKDGTLANQVKYNPLAANPSALVADVAGNIYYVCDDGVYSVDAHGNLRWVREFASHQGQEFTYYHPAVLGPDGVVYAVTSTNQACAFHTSDGSTVWCQAAPTDTRGRGDSYLLGGAGKALFVATGGERIDIVDTGTGQPFGTLAAVVKERIEAINAQWGNAWALGWTFGIANGPDFVFDTCGNLKWSYSDTEAAGGSGVIAAGELLVSISAFGSGDSLRLYDASGNLVAGPAHYEGTPIAAGADGTIYTYRCESGKPAINRILAYSSDLKELWRFDLGGQFCDTIIGNVVLDNDGMMYAKRSTDYGTEVIALQTRSPGLADSSWPSYRHDNRGTAWLVPGAVGPAPKGDGDSSDVIDAPVEGSPGD